MQSQFFLLTEQLCSTFSQELQYFLHICDVLQCLYNWIDVIVYIFCVVCTLYTLPIFFSFIQ